MTKTFESFIQENRNMLLNEAAISDALVKNAMIRKVSQIIPTIEKNKAKELMKTVYAQEILPIATDVLNEFGKILNNTLKSSKFRKMAEKPTVYKQIKSLESLADKVIERNKPLNQIGDIVRGAILFNDASVAQDFVNDIRRKHSGLVIDYEFKEMGKDKEFGYYGSHHLDLLIKGMTVELQVTTKKLWAYKEQAHKIYDELRSAKSAVSRQDRYEKLPDSIKRLLGMYPKTDNERSQKALSKRLFALGNQPSRFVEETENTIFELSNLCEDFHFIQIVLEDIDWEYLK